MLSSWAAGTSPSEHTAYPIQFSYTCVCVFVLSSFPHRTCWVKSKAVQVKSSPKPCNANCRHYDCETLVGFLLKTSINYNAFTTDFIDKFSTYSEFSICDVLVIPYGGKICRKMLLVKHNIGFWWGKR